MVILIHCSVRFFFVGFLDIGGGLSRSPSSPESSVLLSPSRIRDHRQPLRFLYRCTLQCILGNHCYEEHNICGRNLWLSMGGVMRKRLLAFEGDKTRISYRILQERPKVMTLSQNKKYLSSTKKATTIHAVRVTSKRFFILEFQLFLLPGSKLNQNNTMGAVVNFHIWRDVHQGEAADNRTRLWGRQLFTDRLGSWKSFPVSRHYSSGPMSHIFNIGCQLIRCCSCYTIQNCIWLRWFSPMHSSEAKYYMHVASIFFLALSLPSSKSTFSQWELVV